MIPAIQQELRSLEQSDTLRNLVRLPSVGGILTLGSERWLNFSSNDYLDLATHPRLKQAAAKAIEQFGCGSTASRLMAGNLDLYEDLEQDLADWMGGETALVFGSGFLTNLGVITALAGRDTVILADRLNHASLIDGMRLSGCRFERYHHNRPEDLARRLRKIPPDRPVMIVTDSVFSMDGDRAPLLQIAGQARERDAWLLVDEAHALGILGPQGSGLCAGLPPDLMPAVRIGTLGKALGGYGGFVVCSAEIRQWLINKARPFIYSTGLPPACLASAREAVRLVRENQGMGTDLLNRARILQESLQEQGLPLPEVRSAILPLPIGPNQAALALAERLRREKILATAIRPPTVPAGTARLRLSVTLAHSAGDLRWASAKIAGAAAEVGMLR